MPATLPRYGLRRLLAPALLTAALAAFPVVAADPSPIEAEVMIRAGQIAFNAEAKRAREAKALNTDPATLSRARHAAESIVETTADMFAPAANWDWSVATVKSPDPFAYLLTGGKLVVSSAVFDKLMLNDPEYAAIVAHLTAHQALGHDDKYVTAEYVRQHGRTTPDPDPNRAALQVAAIVTELATSKRYTAAEEAAADAFALELLAKAAVNPTSAAAAWRKVESAGGGRAPAVGALHPVDAQRLAALEAKAPEWLPAYQKALATRRPLGLAPPMPRR